MPRELTPKDFANSPDHVIEVLTTALVAKYRPELIHNIPDATQDKIELYRNILSTSRPDGWIFTSAVRSAIGRTSMELAIGLMFRSERDDKYSHSFLLDLLVDVKTAQDMHANLSEVYPFWIKRHGSKRAAWICRVQTIALIFGYVGSNTLSIAERFVKLLKIAP
jgi:hypothetical protein